MPPDAMLPAGSGMITRTEALVIGASAGALEALSVLLPTLPNDYPHPIMMVIHQPRGKSILAELLGKMCRLPVKEAEDKEPIVGGMVYLAPPDYHLLVEKDYRLSLSSDEPVHYSRPSIDVLFESAADAYGDRVAGIILSGANQDGAEGLRRICESGGKGLVQTPGSARAPVMPKAALAACRQSVALELDAMVAHLGGKR